MVPPRLSLCKSRGIFLANIFLLRKEVKKLAIVKLRNGESQDQLLRRFRKKVVKSGVLSTVRRKRWFVSRNEQRRMEKKKAARRLKRKQYTRNYDRR
jgi:small subunit ribosomal protein S21